MEPLDMSRFPGRGELHVERSALPGRRAHVNLSRVLLDDAVADRQAEPGAAAVRFGGEKRIKNAVDILAGNSRAGIRDFDFDAAILRGGADFQHSSAEHGIARVQKEIQENLLQFVGGAVHGRQGLDRKSTRLNSSHPSISYAVFCLKKKKKIINNIK